MNRNFYALVENNQGTVIIETYTFSRALKAAENLAQDKEWAPTTGAYVYESADVLPTVERVKAEGKMIVSLRVIR